MNSLNKKIIISLVFCMVICNISLCQFNTIRSFSFHVSSGTVKPISPTLDTSAAKDMIRNVDTHTSALSSGTGGESPLLCLPLKQIRVTSRYGKRYHPMLHQIIKHNGIDLRAKYVPVYAMADGKVRKVKYDKRSGIYVVIDHDGDSLQSIYCHLSHIRIFPGEKVDGGEQIGISGATGMVTGPHLHFALKWHGQFINPYPILEYMEKFNSLIVSIK